jgi:hypothetical protein
MPTQRKPEINRETIDKFGADEKEIHVVKDPKKK